MKAEINRLFTEKVAEYLSKGYWFSLRTMATTGCSYGAAGLEVGHVDLTNGDEFLRILLMQKFKSSGNLVILRVGRDTERFKNGSVYNHNLEVLEEQNFHVGDENFIY